MSHTNNILAATTEPWVERGATPNPAPHQPSKDLRDTAAGCRERAAADLLHALAMATQNGRQVFEKSAASWTKRADMLQRIEVGIEARLAHSAPDVPEPTEAERAEDLVYSRSGRLMSFGLTSA